MSDVSRTHQNLRDVYAAFSELKKTFERSDVDGNLDKLNEAMRDLENLQRQLQEDEKRRQQEMEKMKQDYEKQIQELQKQSQKG